MKVLIINVDVSVVKLLELSNNNKIDVQIVVDYVNIYNVFLRFNPSTIIINGKNIKSSDIIAIFDKITFSFKNVILCGNIDGFNIIEKGGYQYQDYIDKFVVECFVKLLLNGDEIVSALDKAFNINYLVNYWPMQSPILDKKDDISKNYSLIDITKSRVDNFRSDTSIQDLSLHTNLVSQNKNYKKIKVLNPKKIEYVSNHIPFVECNEILTIPISLESVEFNIPINHNLVISYNNFKQNHTVCGSHNPDIVDIIEIQ